MVALALTAVGPSTTTLHAETDLDAFMREVLSRRDDNWKKLQQYVLDEREQLEVRGPTHQPIWGERREYTWFIREGFFVRSPVRFNGVEVGEAERRKYEAEFLRRSEAREARFNQSSPDVGTSSGSADSTSRSGEVSTNIDGLLRQAREPQFVSSAYFLRFRFEEGKYGLVGREMLDGHEVMRVEYYPTNLYSAAQQRRMARDHSPRDPRDGQVQRMMNKVALVTLWVDSASRQIVKYTFDNIDLDFLPAQWLLRLETVRATMTMGQPFPDIWLPRDLELKAAVDVATGRFDIRWAVEYHDYRQPDVSSKVHIGADR
jgi:hypothetical protein